MLIHLIAVRLGGRVTAQFTFVGRRLGGCDGSSYIPTHLVRELSSTILSGQEQINPLGASGSFSQ